MMNKTLKMIAKAVLIFVLVILVFLLVFWIVHQVRSRKEASSLGEHGMLQLVDVGEYRLNLYRYGNESSPHKIIGISGRGVNNYGIEMKYALEGLEEDHLIVFADRAGYGYSDDTKVRQTVERVVEDYRTALKNAGIEAPYILMPHSLGGVYATYWVSRYPEEIECVIFIDTTELGNDVWEEDDVRVSLLDRMGVLACNLGLHRLFLRQFCYSLPLTYTEEDQRITDYLNIKSLLTQAQLSETEELNRNTNFAFDHIVKNDVPKVYINCSSGFSDADELKEHLQWIRDRKKELGIAVEETEISNEKLEAAVAQLKEWREQRILPYLEKMGNAEIILLPGDHMIFEQKPKELNKLLKEILGGL